MRNGKVFIATYGFPPYLKSLGGSIRILKLAEYLHEQGFDVTVVCARTRHFDTHGYDETLAKIKTIACDDPVATMGSRLTQNTNGQSETTTPTARAGLGKAMARKLKAAVLEVMVPDTGLLVTSHMTRAILDEISVLTEPITVITSGPPHSIHMVGRRLKRLRKDVHWVMDYRDSWNGTSLFQKRHRLTQNINQRIERSCLKQADHLTYISSPMLKKAERIAELALSEKSTLIANGFDERLAPAQAAQTGDNTESTQRHDYRIGYFGVLDFGATSYRDPAVIFRALSSLEDEVKLVIHGPSSLEPGWQQRLGDRLVDGGKLSHTEALIAMTTMDALLLLHTRDEGADEVVTGKVFEYISTGLPIIAVGPKDMAVNALLARDPSFYWVHHHDAVGLSELFVQLRNATRSSTPIRRSPEVIRAYSRTAQHEKFLRLLEAHQ